MLLIPMLLVPMLLVSLLLVPLRLVLLGSVPVIFLFRAFFILSNRAVDPHSFYADPDPAVFLNADPGLGSGPA